MAKQINMLERTFEQHLKENAHREIDDDIESHEGQIEDNESEMKGLREAIDWHREEYKKHEHKLHTTNKFDWDELHPAHTYGPDLPVETKRLSQGMASYGGMEEHAFKTMRGHLSDAVDAISKAHMVFHNDSIQSHRHTLHRVEQDTNHLKGRLQILKDRKTLTGN